MAVLQKKTHLVSVIIINYQTDELVVELVRHLLGLSEERIERRGDGDNQRFEIIIIDNSPQNTLEKKLPQFLNIRYYFQHKNLGFAAGNNVGIKKAKAEWTFLLNSDTVVSGHEIVRLAEICRDNNYEVAAPALLNKDRSPQQSVGYFDKAPRHFINWVLGRPRFIQSNKITQNTPVNIAIGAALLIRKSIFKKVGLLDEQNFFMYFEDIDYCYRLYKQRIPILYIPSVKIVHYKSRSADQDKRRKNINYTNARNAYIKKHRGMFILYLNKLLKLFH